MKCHEFSGIRPTLGVTAFLHRFATEIIDRSAVSVKSYGTIALRKMHKPKSLREACRV